MKSDATSVPEQHPVPREKRPLNPWLLVCGACLGFVIVVVVGLSLLAFFGPKQSLRDNEFLMPDGKVLRIEAVTWGNSHRLDFEYSPPGPWGFWDRRRQPITHGIGVNQLVVWMTCHDARTGRSVDFDWWSESVVIDAHGDEIPDNYQQFWQMGPRGSGAGGGSRPFRSDRTAYDTWLVFSSFPAFRTDQGRFKLQLKNLVGDVATTIELTHPSPPAIQTWQAEELPATKTSGDVAVTLKSLHANFHWNTSNGVKRKWWYYSPDATVSVNGQLVADWYVTLMETTDPLGNNQNYGQSLSIREPTWKVRLAACRVQASKFSAAETWVLPDLSLPERDLVTLHADSQTIGGVTVTLAALAGVGKTSYSVSTPGIHKYGNFNSSTGGSAFGSATKIETKRNGLIANSIVEADWPHLTLETSGLTPLHRVYLLAKDNQNRDVPTQQAYRYGEVQSFFFQIEPDAKSLTLSIIVHKGHEFEFFIKPPELPEDKPMP